MLQSSIRKISSLWTRAFTTKTRSLSDLMGSWNWMFHVANIFLSDADAGKGIAKIVLTDYLGFTQKLERGEEIWKSSTS